MKIKIDVNLELGLQEYGLQQAEKSIPESVRRPDWMEITEYEAPAQAAFRTYSKKALH
ncbi:MAG: hypothetical protein WBQ78_00070 [Gammaproteobacteria bacterium]